MSFRLFFDIAPKLIKSSKKTKNNTLGFSATTHCNFIPYYVDMKASFYYNRR